MQTPTRKPDAVVGKISYWYYPEMIGSCEIWGPRKLYVVDGVLYSNGTGEGNKLFPKWQQPWLEYMAERILLEDEW